MWLFGCLLAWLFDRVAVFWRGCLVVWLCGRVVVVEGKAALRADAACPPRHSPCRLLLAACSL